MNSPHHTWYRVRCNRQRCIRQRATLSPSPKGEWHSPPMVGNPKPIAQRYQLRIMFTTAPQQPIYLTSNFDPSPLGGIQSKWGVQWRSHFDPSPLGGIQSKWGGHGVATALPPQGVVYGGGVQWRSHRPTPLGGSYGGGGCSGGNHRYFRPIPLMGEFLPKWGLFRGSEVPPWEGTDRKGNYVTVPLQKSFRASESQLLSGKSA